MIQKVVVWVQENVGEKASKSELVQKADNSSLPPEAKAAFNDLPEGEHSKESIITSVKESLMAGVGGGDSGLGGMLGRGM